MLNKRLKDLTVVQIQCTWWIKLFVIMINPQPWYNNIAPWQIPILKSWEYSQCGTIKFHLTVVRNTWSITKIVEH